MIQNQKAFGKSLALMKKEARRTEPRERDERRMRLGRGAYDVLVRELVRVFVLSFEAGATLTLFGLEGLCVTASAQISACRGGAGLRQIRWRARCWPTPFAWRGP